MAYGKQRSNGRWTAIYNEPTGKQKSAGTFDTEDQAVQVARDMEVYVRTGSKGVDPARRKTMTIAEYAPTWLRNHRIEPSTRSGYRAILNAHVLPAFGHVRVAELQREAVRAYLTGMAEKGMSVSSQRYVRSVLSAMMQTAWDDGYRGDNPIRGLRVQRGSRKQIVVLRNEEFGRAYRELPTAGARMLARFTVSTGCRFGESAVLLVSDFDWDRGRVTFAKALQDVGSHSHPDGKSRFHVAPYTKDHGSRTITVDKLTLAQMRKWIEDHDLGPGDLVFPRSLVAPRQHERRVRIDLTEELLATLGAFTAPNGREYRHGTMNGYVTGKCKCDYCKQGFADYRYLLDHSNRGVVTTAQKMPSERFYDETDFLYDTRWAGIWQAACAKAGLSFAPTAYQLRHTHASWLIAAGEDPKTVMTRLGHKDLSTTSLYVHAVEDDSSSADIMADLGLDWDVA